MYKSNMICAMDENLCIGIDEKLPPWELSADIKFFRNATLTSGIVIMGRKTFDSLPKKFKPLPDRLNVVLSRDEKFKIKEHNCLIINSIEEARRIFCCKSTYVIGGAQIYKAFLPYTDRLLITHVKTKINGGNVFFPEIDLSKWKRRKIMDHSEDEKNKYSFTIMEYTR